jgi:hypothetical protein
MSSTKPLVSHARLCELFSYDAGTGKFARRMSEYGKRAGAEPGRVNTWGYRYINIDSRAYGCHRLAWYYVYGYWPIGEIDHINGDPLDKRICNLREASSSQNKQNRRPRRGALAGLKGVSRCCDRPKWRARITVNRREVVLGYFDTKEQAHAAYIAAAQRHFGAFARLA